MEIISTTGLAIVLIFLLFISVFFSAAEAAIMNLNRYRLRHLANQGHQGALRCHRLLSQPDRLIGLIQIGNNLINVLAAVIATLLGIRFYENLGIAIATGGLTLAILIFAEAIPKSLATISPEKVAFPSSRVLTATLILLTPLIDLIQWITVRFLKLIRVKHFDTRQTLTSKEIRNIVKDATATHSKNHQQMLLSMLDLEQLTVEDIMVPKSEIYAINTKDNLNVIQQELAASPHNQILIYQDNIDNAIGFIALQKAFRLLAKKQLTSSSLARAVSPIYFIPETTPVSLQLNKFKTHQNHLGLVVNEYGDIQGLLSLTDIIEYLVENITHQDVLMDEENEQIHPQQDGSYLIDASINIKELNRIMSWHFPTNGPKTLNGLILEYLENIPTTKSSVKIAGYPIEIIEMANQMVKSVRIKPYVR